MVVDQVFFQLKEQLRLGLGGCLCLGLVGAGRAPGARAREGGEGGVGVRGHLGDEQTAPKRIAGGRWICGLTAFSRRP